MKTNINLITHKNCVVLNEKKKLHSMSPIQGDQCVFFPLEHSLTSYLFIVFVCIANSLCYVLLNDVLANFMVFQRKKFDWKFPWAYPLHNKTYDLFEGIQKHCVVDADEWATAVFCKYKKQFTLHVHQNWKIQPHKYRLNHRKVDSKKKMFFCTMHINAFIDSYSIFYMTSFNKFTAKNKTRNA